MEASQQSSSSTSLNQLEMNAAGDLGVTTTLFTDENRDEQHAHDGDEKESHKLEETHEEHDEKAETHDESSDKDESSNRTDIASNIETMPGSDVSSLELSSLTDEFAPHSRFRDEDDLIGHHLNRSAMLTAYRRRIMLENSPRRYHHSAYYHNHHLYEQQAASWANPPPNPAWSTSGDAVLHHTASPAIIVGSDDIAVTEELDESLQTKQDEDLFEENGPSNGGDQKETLQHEEQDGMAQVQASDTDSMTQPSNDEPKDHENMKGDEGAGDASSVISSPYQHGGSEDSKFEHYALLVDPNQGDRAVEIELYSFARPHMRAFHLAWMSFFVAFFTWFAITPLLSEVARSLHLDSREIWTSSTLAVAGSAVTRVLIGPVCDKYGARWAMSGTLVISAIPTALLGLVNSAIGLSMLRLVIGIAGSAFVTSQYWTSSFFTLEVAGTANALVAGWGNLGGGVTQIVMGTLLFPLFKIMYGGTFGAAPQLGDDDAHNHEREEDRPADLAWRTVCVIPALLCFIMAFCMVRYSDDSPKGNYGKRRREGLRDSVSAGRSLKSGLSNFNTWVLLLQYGCCFGVEITMVNAAALYFKEEFGQSTESAAAIASIFGWMNLFARGIGGFASDMTNAKWGMRGRLIVQTIALLLEGVFVIVFSETQTLGGAIAVMVVFSIFVQAAEGSTYGIVPYVNPNVTGVISGVVGAGGNVGGVAFSLIFRENSYRRAFKNMGYIVLGSAVFTPLIRIQGHRSLLFGTDAPEVQSRRASHMHQMGSIPSVCHSSPNEGGAGNPRASSQLRRG